MDPFLNLKNSRIFKFLNLRHRIQIRSVNIDLNFLDQCSSLRSVSRSMFVASDQYRDQCSRLSDQCSRLSGTLLSTLICFRSMSRSMFVPQINVEINVRFWSDPSAQEGYPQNWGGNIDLDTDLRQRALISTLAWGRSMFPTTRNIDLDIDLDIDLLQIGFQGKWSQLQRTPDPSHYGYTMVGTLVPQVHHEGYLSDPILEPGGAMVAST